MKNSFNVFGDINVQHQHINFGHTFLDPLAFPHDINNAQVQAPAEAARPDIINQAPVAAPAVVPEVNHVPVAAPAVVPEVNHVPVAAPAVVPDVNHAPAAAPAVVPDVNQAPVVAPAVIPNVNRAVVPAVHHAVLPDIDNPLALGPNPLPEPRRSRRARHGAEDSTFVCDNPRFWRKIRSLPNHLRFVFLPGCDLWDFRVFKEYLRVIIQHFVPGLFITQNTCKAGYIALFHRHVLRSYGARYRIEN